MRDPDLVQIGGVAELFLIDMDTLSIEQDNINGVPRIGVCTVTKEGAGQQREFLRTCGRRQDEEGAEQKRRQGSNVVLIVLDCGHYFAFGRLGTRKLASCDLITLPEAISAERKAVNETHDTRKLPHRHDPCMCVSEPIRPTLWRRRVTCERPLFSYYPLCPVAKQASLCRVLIII